MEATVASEHGSPAVLAPLRLPIEFQRFSGESQLLTFTWSEAGATGGFDEIGTEVFQVRVFRFVFGHLLVDIDGALLLFPLFGLVYLDPR